MCYSRGLNQNGVKKKKGWAYNTDFTAPVRSKGSEFSAGTRITPLDGSCGIPQFLKVNFSK